MAHRGYRYRLYPTSEQEELFRQFAGVCRLVYNLALEQREIWFRQYERNMGKRLNAVAQNRELTELRAAFDWIAAVPCNAQQNALRDLDQAFTNFFAGRARYPRPRCKGEHDAFRFPAVHCGNLEKINAKWSRIRLPKLGTVKIRTDRPLCGKPLSITVSANAGKWYASSGCEVEFAPPAENARPMVGIDRGVVQTLTLSTGAARSIDRERLNVLDRRARRASRIMARRRPKPGQRGSSRYKHAKMRLARIKAKSARYRKDWLHKITYDIATRFDGAVLEDLKTRNMTATAKGTVEEPGRNVQAKAGLNRAILEQGWHQFAVLLGYKLEERGGHLIKVPAAYTSQTCATCGAVDAANRPAQARLECIACGHTAHADHNAALNILDRGQSVGAAGVSPSAEPVAASVRRKATGRKAPKTSPSGEAQLFLVRMAEPSSERNRPLKAQRRQGVAG